MDPAVSPPHPGALAALLLAAQAAASPTERDLIEHDIVAMHLPMARRLAYRYANRGAEVDDLCAVANLALVKAIRGFHPERGEFGSYAASTILGDIKKHFRDHCWTIKPTRRIQDLQAEIMHAIAEREQEDVPVSTADLAAHLGVPVPDVAEALVARGHFSPRSLDAPGRNGAPTMGAMMPVDDDPYERVDQHSALAAACHQLDADERDLVRLRFFEERTQQQIAEVVGVSQMQVSRRLKNLVEKLRSLMLSEHEVAA
jgi:RNA polymerase sigma-B factor